MDIGTRNIEIIDDDIAEVLKIKPVIRYFCCLEIFYLYYES
jgi:hypothetical protein